PFANRRARLPAEAATASPHAGHAIQDAVLLVMPEPPVPRHIVAPAGARGKGPTRSPGTGGEPDSCLARWHGAPPEGAAAPKGRVRSAGSALAGSRSVRSEGHTSELQSTLNL